MEFVRCYELPDPSTAMSDVALNCLGGVLSLCYSCDRDGVVYRGGIRFQGVRAHRHIAEMYATVEQIEAAYDALVELRSSQWIDELRSEVPADQMDEWPLRHYMVVFDSSGCFEVVAETWQALPEEST
jgi:hypothetical protein